MNSAIRGIAARNSVPFLAASIVVVAAGGVLALPALLMVSAAFLGTVWFCYASHARLSDARESRDAAALMGRLHAGISSGAGPLASVMRSAVQEEGCQWEGAKAICRIRGRMLLGQMLDDSIAHEPVAGNRSVAEAVERIGTEYSAKGEVHRSPGESFRSIESRIRLDSEHALGAIHKYLVAGMVSNTVVPSMAVFAFVGYSIFYYSQAQFVLFAVVLLALLPAASRMAYTKLGELYDE